MRIISSAEASYNATYPDYGYACPLSVLGGNPGSSPPTPQAATLIDPALANSGQQNGYVFTITCGSKIALNNHDVYTSYIINGVPIITGKVGNNGFCMDEHAKITMDPNGGTNCTQPILRSLKWFNR
jgi:type IV pilus assembly protein PilA